MFSETKARSATKAILWRLVAVTNSFVISWLFFETILVALGAAVAMNVTGLFIYYLYERAWNKVGWGKVGLKKWKPQIILTERDLLTMDCPFPPEPGYEKFNGQEQIDIYTGQRMSFNEEDLDTEEDEDL